MLSPTCLGIVAVATSGTPVRLASTQTPCCKIQFSVPSANTGKSYVGNSALDHTSGAGVIRELVNTGTGAQNDQYTIESQDGSNRLDVSDYYLDVAVSGEGVSVTYWRGV